jgi:uncharacterized protein YgbK (DUF1537 family)
MIKQVDPGAPLSKAYSKLGSMDGMELALKGGQFGRVDYFVRLLDL